MERLSISVVLIAVLIMSPNLLALDAQKVMHKVNNRYLGDDAQSTMTLVHKSKSGADKRMTMAAFNRETSDGNQTLLKFEEPAFMKDSGLLVHSFDHDANLQWLYLSRAARRDPRRISSSEKGRPLFGTDIYFVDIESKSVTDFVYKLVETTEIEGRKVAVIEADSKDSGYPYSKTVSWVDLERNIEVQIDYFENGHHTKTLKVEEVKLVEDIWSVMEFRVRNHKNSSTTLMKIENLDYNSGLKDSQFSFRALTDRRR